MSLLRSTDHIEMGSQLKMRKKVLIRLKKKEAALFISIVLSQAIPNLLDIEDDHSQFNEFKGMK